jgi:flagellar motility protein MotE (MotC chaperone)
VGTALALLMITKIIMSGFYLQTRPIPFAAANLAMAESGAGVSMESGPAPVALSGEMLVKKAQELNAKEIALQKREKNLLPLKNEIDERLAQLNELQLQLTAYAKKLADREKALDDSRIGHIVELYAAMEPARAAAIMDKLKIPTVVRILRNMKGKSAGKILSVMKPERGALISEKLTQLD